METFVVFAKAVVALAVGAGLYFLYNAIAEALLVIFIKIFN